MIRSVQELSLQRYALHATVTGFLISELQQTDEAGLSLEQRAEALAQTIRSAIEPKDLPGEDKLKQIAIEMKGWLQELITVFEAKIQEPRTNEMNIY